MENDQGDYTYRPRHYNICDARPVCQSSWRYDVFRCGDVLDCPGLGKRREGMML